MASTLAIPAEPGQLAGELSSAERADLVRLERVVDRGKRVFREVAFALMEIHDRQLFRHESRSFAEYCQTRHGLGRRQAYYLLDGAKLIEECEEAGVPPPQSETQARRMRQAARIASTPSPQPPSIGGCRAHLDRREVLKRINAQTPGLGKTIEIDRLIGQLQKLHASHPHRAKADELLSLYRELVLPWPAESFPS